METRAFKEALEVLIRAQLCNEGERSINLNPAYDNLIDPDYYDTYAEQRHGDYFTKQLVAVLCHELPPQRESQTTVLDLAAGTGRNALALQKAGYAATASDMSEDMLAALRRKDTSARIRTAPSADMNKRFDFADNTFDAVVTMWANRFMKDTTHIASEASRILKPGGVFVWPIFPGENMIWEYVTKRRQPNRQEEFKKILSGNGFDEVKIVGLTDLPASIADDNPPYFLVARKKR